MRIRVKAPEGIFIHDVKKETTSIGRDLENDFVLPMIGLSRKHCLVTLKGDYAFIMDLGSKNGVTIDGTRIPPHEHFPIYPHSNVILAEAFEFILATMGGSEELQVRLNETIKRNR